MNELIRPVIDDKIPEYERLLAKGGTLAINAELVPVQYCQSVLSEPDDPPCSLEEAKEVLTFLIGAYPKREVNDPNIYSKMMRQVFAEFSKGVGIQAVERIVRRLKFLPTVADVQEACDEIAGAEKLRRSRAQRMLAEHDRRRQEAEHDAQIAIERNNPEERARLLKTWANRKAELAENSAMLVRQSTKRIDPETSTAELDQAGWDKLHNQRMAQQAADGLPTDGLERGELPPGEGP